MKETKLFHELWLCVTTKCNASCEYCWWTKFGGWQKKIDMSIDVADAALDFIERNVVEGATVTFFGGEPLMNFDVVKYIMNKKKCWNYHMFTNASLLTEDIVRFFKERKDFIRLSLSIDGSEQTQIQNRGVSVDYDLVSSVLKTLDRSIVKATIIDPSRLYEDMKFLSTLGANEIEINIPEFVDLSEEYYRIFDEQFEMCNNDSDITHIPKPFNSRVGASFCRCAENKMSIMPNGDIYPCDVFSCFNINEIGNVYDGINDIYRDAFMSKKKGDEINGVESTCYAYNLYLRGEVNGQNKR